MAKILYVEDEELLVQVFSEELKNEGFTVESATDGEVALIKVNEFQPDLILLDVKLPKLSGLEVLEKLKEKEETKHIPVIMFTNQGDKTADVEAAIKLGAVSYLIKAEVTPKELTDKVREIVGGYVDETKKFY